MSNILKKHLSLKKKYSKQFHSKKQQFSNGDDKKKILPLKNYLLKIASYIEQNQGLVGRILLLINENYSNPELNLAFLSNKLGINSSYLSRLFKKSYGENFLEYIVKLRIQKACFLLETTKLKNVEISKQVGFEDDHYFTQVFKKRCNLTPKQYREKFKK